MHVASRGWILAASLLLAMPAAGAEPDLVGWWTFDESTGARCADSSGRGHHAGDDARVALGVGRTEGPFGRALSLSGGHLVAIPGKPDLDGLDAVSFSAWVLPGDLSDYREIFRKEDGDRRVLFSFQGSGTILSLGLDIGGYVECDAPVDPARVLDGSWHHCAATFDGRTMRVWLDGAEIGSLDRPGRIAAGGSAPGCIGSSNGSECFHGAIDDLRILSRALAPDEIAAMHREGRASLDRLTSAEPAGEPVVDPAPIACWTFNERAGKVLRETSGATPALDVEASGLVRRRGGVHGGAIELRGEHALPVAIGPRLGSPEGFAISVWARPSDLSSFREIFRQECGHRILFSFQEGGGVLSLGLDVGGYAECDARIEPGRLLDGDWHHAAATFDGRTFRVWVDGAEVGSLDRPGKLSVDPAAIAFIGSSGGTGEHFQGALDDLRVWTRALSAEEVAGIHRHGVEALDRRATELADAVAGVYARQPSFAETVAASRKAIVESSARFDGDVAEVVLRKLRADFPEETERLAAITGRGPIDFLAAADDSFEEREAARLVDLLLEYRPLTEGQWSRQTPEELAEWKEADRIAARYEALRAEGAGARFSPAWIQTILEAGARVRLRPYQNEPVAPRVRPETPVTRDLGPEEAGEALRRDWLHQADGNPTPERIRSEIGWARDLARRIQGAGVDLSDDLRALDELEGQAVALGASDPELYFRVREAKRRIAFRNPVVDFDRVLFVDMPYPAGSEWPHETRHRLGYMAVPGGRLLVLEGLSPAGKLRQLLPIEPLHGSFWRPDLSWDGTRVVVCFKPHNEKSFHLYEVGIDGSGFRQLTHGKFDDLDPIWLPDGEHILFSTTRGHTYVRCMPPTNAYSLARCDLDGRNIYLTSYNNEPDYLPSVLNDGRVIYTRWEYTDKPLWRPQKLWTVNPDGTQTMMYWGNQSVWPDLVKDARAIPGSRRVMATGSAHHDWFSGSVAIIDVTGGLNFPGGITKVTADVPWPECGNGPVDPVEKADYHRSGDYPAYYSPYPLGEEDFLVSARRGGKFLLYLMDVHGNRELVYEGVHNIFHALPVRPRARPQVIVDRVDWPSREERDVPGSGVFFSANVLEGTPPALRGKVRHLRILHIDPKTYTYWYKRPYISTGPVVSAVQSEGVKRILGTVPVEEDGSVCFRAPAGMALHFQILDEQFRALQTMRSFVGLMPGEYRGCVGCHESHSRAPPTEMSSRAIAAGPRDIVPPPWEADTVSYPRYVQPVLDRYCGSCHQGEGKARETLDLTLRPGFDIFTEPYLTLIGRPTWGAPYQRPATPPPGFGIAGMLMVEGYSTVDPAAYVTPEPMKHLSYASRLVEIASSGEHHDVKVDPVSLRRLIGWIDAMCPYVGDEEVRQIPDPVFQGVDWLAIRPRIQTAPKIVRPGPVD